MKTFYLKQKRRVAFTLMPPLAGCRFTISIASHEYFRRILCNLIGQWVEDGDVPNDEALLGQMVQASVFIMRNAILRVLIGQTPASVGGRRLRLAGSLIML